MTGPRSGSAHASEWVSDIAQALAEALPGPVEVLVGVTLADRTTDRRVVLDLVVIAGGAAFVGIDARENGAHRVAPCHAANLLASALQRGKGIADPVAVYAFWLGDVAQEGLEGNAPVLADADLVKQYVLRATEDGSYTTSTAPRAVAEYLLEQDDGPVEGRSSPLDHLHRGLRHLIELPRHVDAGLQEQIRRPFFLGRHRPILPADVIRHLERAMFAQRNVREGADYARIVPNGYLVELNEANYRRNYAPIESQVCERWQADLKATLDTANERLGRQAYTFGGEVCISIRPTSDLVPGSVRIQATIGANLDARPGLADAVYLESISDRQRWPLQGRQTTIGRDRGCDVWLGAPAVQEARLVSGSHAHILYRDGAYHLFDGAPGGKRSVNGTFVNGHQVGPGGRRLEDGDVILLASLDPQRPRLDTPGVAAFAFHTSAREPG